MELTERQSLFFGVDARGRVEDGDVAGGLLGADARYYFRQSPRRVLFLNLSATAGSQPRCRPADPARRRQRPARLSAALPGRRGPLAVHGRAAPVQQLVSRSRCSMSAARCSTTWAPPGAATRSARPRKACCKDVGFGLRFGNSRSALGNVLHIDVAYPLDGDPSVRQHAVPRRNEEELLMRFPETRLRPMLRVETVLLVVDRLARRHAQRRVVERGGRGARLVRSRELAVHRCAVSWRWSHCTSCCWRPCRIAGRCGRC